MCLAVWIALAGRSVIDKVVAIVVPISAFVAAGFEHSVANMYLIPMAMLLQRYGENQTGPAITWLNFFSRLFPVVIGNIIGGSVLVGLVYQIVYRHMSDK